MGNYHYNISDFITLAVKPSCDNKKEMEEYAKSRLARYDFEHFRLQILPGRYSGFSINIKFNFPFFFTTRECKNAALKEVSNIKEFLYECANIELIAYCPMRDLYHPELNTEETLKEIGRAIKEMRETVRETPTWNQYQTECA